MELEAKNWSLGRSVLVKTLAVAMAATGCGNEIAATRGELGQTLRSPEARISEGSERRERDEGLEYPEFSRMPKVRFTEKVPKISKPTGLDMSDEDFLLVSQELLAAVESYLLHTYYPESSQAQNKFDRDAVYTQLRHAIHTFGSSNPRTKKYFQTFSPQEVMLKMIPFALAAGYYFHGTEVNGNFMPQWYEIDKGEILELHDENVAIDCPVFVLKGGNKGQAAAGWTLQEQKVSFVMSTEVMDFEANNFIQYFPPELFAEAKKELQRDMKIHEATHVFTISQFPEIRDGKMASSPVEEVRIEDGILHMKPFYTLKNFDELCAVGSSLFHSRAQIPLGLVAHLLLPNDSEDYELLKIVLCATILKFAPDSDLKRNIMQNFRETQKLKMSDIIQLVVKTFAKEDIKRIGAHLYSVGYEGLKRSRE